MRTITGMNRITDALARRMARRLGYLFLVALSMVTLVTKDLQAQAAQASSQEKDISFSVTAVPIYQFKANLDEGGDVSASQYILKLEARRGFSKALSMGLALEYDYRDYSFSGVTSLGGRDPWGDVQGTGLSLPVVYRMNDQWSFFVSPSVRASWESGSDWDDSFVYGGVVAASYTVSPNFRIGAGFGVFTGLEDTKFFPQIVIDWKITEQLRLTNPLRPGPTGPAGLELSYRFSKEWETSVGGAYRSLRFRLDDSGVAPEGVGEESGVLGWLSLSWMPVQSVDLALLGGAVLGGKLKVYDRRGHRLASDTYDPAPFVALSAKFSF